MLNKPWSSYYVKNSRSVNPEMTLYEAYISNNKENLDGIALYSLSRKHAYTHGELMQTIEDFSAALVKNGIGEGSKIGALLFNSYEEAVALLASSKIGGCIKYIDFSKNIENVIENIIFGKFDIIIVDEALVELVNHAPGYEGLVIVANGSKYSCKEGQILFDEFIKQGKGVKTDAVEYIKYRPSVVIFSSGTTGKPKPIVHSDYTINIAVNKVLSTDFLMEHGNLMVCNIPSFIGLGLITCLYSSLIAGVSVVFIECKMPEESISNTVSFVKDYSLFVKEYNVPSEAKLNMFSSPMFFRAIADADIGDLSFFGGLLAAGAKMGEQELENINKIFRQRGCDLPICNGYGQNEMCGAVTLNSISHNKNGSAGYPAIDTEIKIVDNNTLEEVSVGNEGLILERSLSQFLYYENMPKETKNSMIVLKDGQEWYDTKDLGYMDDDGFLYITGRTTRVIIVHDCKISIDTIEEKIRLFEGVEECGVIVDYTDEGEKAIAFISLKNGANQQFVFDIISGDNNGLSEFERPAKVIFLEEMPRLGSEKIDYLKLKEMLN